jgi:hypothetical protein
VIGWVLRVGRVKIFTADGFKVEKIKVVGEG